MKLTDLEPVLVEALAAHEHFRIFGYAPDEIFALLDGVGVLHVRLVRGGKHFTYTIGAYPFSRADFPPVWEAAIRCWNEDATDAERKAAFDNSHTRGQAVPLIAAMLAKGFAARRSDA